MGAREWRWNRSTLPTIGPNEFLLAPDGQAMNEDARQYARATVLAGTILIVGTFLLLALAQLQVVLSVVFLGIVVGLALSPLADYLTRFHVPRAVSVLGVYAFVLGLLALFLWYAIPQIATEARALFEQSGEFEESYAEIAEGTPLPPLSEVQSALESFASGIGPAVAEQALVAFNAGLYVFSLFVIALFFTITKDRARELFISLQPEERRQRCDEVLDIIAQKLRRYLFAEFLSMALIGVMTYVGLTLLGVPFALTLATFAFLLSIIPIIGPTIAFAAAFLVALTQGVSVALIVAGYYLFIEAIESNVLIPLIQRSQTSMPELLILISILVGGALMGILGALVALPATLIGYVILMEVVVPWRREQVGWKEPSEEGSG